MLNRLYVINIFFMMKYFLFFTTFICFLACSNQDIVEKQPEITSTLRPINYLALGDSYTIGESVSEKERYPMQLVAALIKDSILIEKPKIIARTGWTTDELQEAIHKENIKDTFDLVSLLIGVNNQFRNYSLAKYQIEFDTLLRQAIDFAGGNREKIFVISIPDYGFTPFGQQRNPTAITASIDAFNSANQAITLSYGISYFNITDISRRGIAQPNLVADDKLHPSGEQYQLWVNSFYNAVKAKLKN